MKEKKHEINKSFHVIKINSSVFPVLLQELGYQGEIGYQTFLYSNETDIRKIFIFLIEKLPKESVGTTDETLGKSQEMSKVFF